MNHHRPSFMRLALGLLGLLGACLPSMPEGDRGPQCWLGHAQSSSECTRERIRCLDGLDADDVDALQRCDDHAERCRAEARETLEACERRSGCVDQHTRCWEECGLQVEPSVRERCQSSCAFDFESCAPWYEPECERDCRQVAATCDAEAERTHELVRCEDDRLECVLECY